ncbi:hypothetical protein PROFUN_06510 [Planoprotostelium fungivorum]|uniref:Selenoprotein H n=1 Tax=Planoprotostelium fungivorum TaxID=1890364 RepID=A0A2P6NP05_9EUKA|nr:hypothetical protein PROFUN_06510 [Planoprotostelium fungivorum]
MPRGKRKKVNEDLEEVVVKNKGKALVARLEEEFPSADIEVKLGRKNSFEVDISIKEGPSVSVWSGINLGPPRKLKWPDHDVVVQRIRDHLEGKENKVSSEEE